MIKRFYNIKQLLKPNKVLIIYGARRVGKTTLLNDFLQKTKLKYKLDSGDNIRTQAILGSQNFDEIIEYASGYDLIAIDEAQQIPNIGRGLKILVDQIPNIKVIATGSSSFDLSQKIGEPLTGRNTTIKLYPFSQAELLVKYNKFELKESLADFLVFGSYPDVITASSKKEKKIILTELVNSYLLKDIFSLEKIKSSNKIFDLLKLIAFQIGSEVSLSELATQIGLDVKTIDKYLDLLEKSFIIKRVGSFSRNLRNEVSTKSKYYFLDNGIRNAIISQFNNLKDRNDTGFLFENFLIAERLKFNFYNNNFTIPYFWRNYNGKEIDLIEERDAKIFTFEFKWSEKRKQKLPQEFLDNYKNVEYQIINQKNYLDFIL